MCFIRVMEVWGCENGFLQSLNSTLTQIGDFYEINRTSIKPCYKKGKDTYSGSCEDFQVTGVN